MSVTIIYGSDGGCTRNIANKIAKKISGKAIDITDAEPTDMDEMADAVLRGSISSLLPRLVGPRSHTQPG